MPTLADRLDAALPQTQCRRCGYDDCRAYAEAMASGAAHIDRCPPGGAEGVRRLAAISGLSERPLEPTVGTEGPLRRAAIDEAACIGCTRCLPACPVDCIVGGPKSLHVVIASLCTGCELCGPACPVDCIAFEPVDAQRTGWDAWSEAHANTARERYAVHRSRSTVRTVPPPAELPDRRAVIEAALRRAREATR